VAEGTSLLRMHTAYTCIVSSNLTVSASIKRKPLSNQRLGGFLHFLPIRQPMRLLKMCFRSGLGPSSRDLVGRAIAAAA
jgi:hypothetical protein